MKNYKKNVLTLAVASSLLVIGCGERQNAQDYILQAEEATINQDKKTAILHYKNAIKIEKDNASTRQKLGALYLDLGDLISAKKELELAVELGSRDENTYLGLARVYYLLSQKDELNQLLLISQDSQHVSIVANTYLAILALYSGNQEEANEYVNIANDLSEESIFSILGRAWELAGSDVNASINEIDKLLKDNPDFEDAAILKAHLLYGQTKYGEAGSIYKAYIEAHPEEDRVKVFLLKSYLNDKKYTEATDLLNELLAKYKNNPYLNRDYAIIKLNEKDFGRANQFAQKAASRLSNDTTTNVILGLTHYKLEQLEQSYQALNKVKDAFPANHPISNLHKSIQSKLGYFESTIEELLGAEVIYDQDINVLVGAVTKLVNAGKQEKAKEVIQAVSQKELEAEQNLALMGQIKLFAGDKSGIALIEEALKGEELSEDKNLGYIQSLLIAGEVAKARNVINEWLKQSADSENALLMDSMVYWAEGAPKDSLERVSKVLELSPNHQGALYLQAKYYYDNQQYKESFIASKKLIDINLEHVAAYDLFEKSSVKISREEDAIQHLKKVISANPESVVTRATLIKFLRNTNKIKQAALEIISLLSLDNLSHSQKQFAGQQLLVNGSIDKAKEVFIELVNSQENSVRDYLMLASVHELKRDYVSALEVVNLGIKEKGDTQELKVMEVSYLLMLGQVELANRNFNTMDKKGLNSIILNKLRGELSYAKQDYRAATKYLESVNTKGASTSVVKMLASSYIALKEPNKAIDVLEKHLTRSPSDTAIIFDLATLYGREKEHEKSIRKYEILIKVNPRNFVPLNNVAIEYLAVGKKEKAKDAIVAALALTPNNAAVLDTAGLVYKQLGEYAESVEYFSKAYESTNSTSVTYALNLLDALVASNRSDEAKSLAQNIKPKDDIHKSKLNELLKRLN